MYIFILLIIPFIGTMIGSLMVYFIKEKLNKTFEILLLGFASGIMVVASIWSLIIPSIENSNSIFIPSLGIILGTLIFFLLDKYLNKKNLNLYNIILPVTIHNIPEGMSVGIVLSSLNKTSTLALSLTVSLGIAIQNIPDGIIASLPLVNRGLTKNKAFFYGLLSAIIELLSAIISYFFTNLVTGLLPLLLALSGGIMLYIVTSSLIPESSTKNNLNTIGFTIGFVLMMILDIVLT